MIDGPLPGSDNPAFGSGAGAAGGGVRVGFFRERPEGAEGALRLTVGDDGASPAGGFSPIFTVGAVAAASATGAGGGVELPARFIVGADGAPGADAAAETGVSLIVSLEVVAD